MESIDRLRKYVANHTDWTVALTTYPELYEVRCATTINDLIDAIEREVKESYIELPKDADGEYIRVGDKLVGFSIEGESVSECTRLVLTDDWLVCRGLGIGTANSFVHYKPPTVEDVLNELCTKAFHSREIGAHVSYKDVIAEYAAKLQLKEEQ